MKFFHRSALLSLCVVLLLGGLTPVRAEEPGEGQTQVYYDKNQTTFDVWLWPGDGFDELRGQVSGGTLYLRGEDEVDAWFDIRWDESAFMEQLTQGALEFTIYGEYYVDPWFFDENVTIAEGTGAALRVHVRGPDQRSAFTWDGEGNEFWAATLPQGIGFAEAELDDNIWLAPTAESPFDLSNVPFSVTWDEAAFTAGISGTEPFQITGTVGPPTGELYRNLWDQGLIDLELEGRTPTMDIRIRTPAEGPGDFCNPTWNGKYIWPYEFLVCLPAGTDFDPLLLPQIGWLESADGTEERAFGLLWDRDAYEVGMASGADSFIVSGVYTANPDWTQAEQDWWDQDGYQIQEGTPAPVLTVYLAQGELPYTVSMREHGGELAPVFTFLWPGGAGTVTLLFSMDKETWYEDALPWSEDFNWSEVQAEGGFYDEEDKQIVIPADAPTPFYCRLNIAGSPFAGETAVMIVSPDENGNWEMTEDPGGDHGGGGQGQHDRPGKEEPDDPPEKPAEPTPDQDDQPPLTPDPPSESDGHFIPKPTPTPTPKPASTPDLLPTPEAPPPGPVPDPIPDQVPPESVPSADLPALEVQPIPEGGIASPSFGGGKTADDPCGVQTELDPKPSHEPVPPLGTSTGESAPAAAPEDQVPNPTSQPPASPAPTPAAQATPSRIPGFAVAGLATSAVLLCGGLWFHWRGKRK